MTINNIKTKFLLTLLVGGLFFLSCEDKNDDNLHNNLNSLTEEEAIALIESDNISDEMDNIIEDILLSDFGGFANKEEASKSNNRYKDGMPSCLTKTIVLQATSKSVTLDFGEGCELPNGHIITGKIIMSYEFNLALKAVTATITYDGFTFNDVAVEGENIIIRTWNDGALKSVKTMNVTHTWPDNETVVKTGTLTKECIEGCDTKTWKDNVYAITGSHSTRFKNGTVCKSEIITPLRREMNCRFIVSGTVEISKGDKFATLDFGDGTCDDKASITDADGKVKEIKLRKRKMRK